MIDDSSLAHYSSINNTSIESYKSPKTCHYISHDYSFPKAARKLPFEENISISPGPADHSETFEKSQHRYWEKPTGTFAKAPKDSFIPKTLKKIASLPGPGHYFPKITEEKTKSKMGIIGKETRPGFLDNTEALSQTVPSSYIYKPYEPGRRLKNGIYHSMYYKPDPESLKTKTVGPGSYYPEVSLDKRVLKRTVFFKLSKAERLVPKNGKNKNKRKRLYKSEVPPVGTYDLLSGSDSMANGMKRKKPIISPYELMRTIEMEVKQKAGLPGPGAYDIGPLPKLYKNYKGDYESETPLRKKFIGEV